MNTTSQTLARLRSLAQSDAILRSKLLSTRGCREPMEAFCRLAEEAGCPLTVGELLALGQENSDNQCKSTNGGNPSPYESFEDEYENFLFSL